MNGKYLNDISLIEDTDTNANCKNKPNKYSGVEEYNI